MESNTSPYATPESVIGQVEEQLDVVPAKISLRFINFVIDYVTTTIISAIIGIVIVTLFGEQAINSIGAIEEILWGLAITILYYVLFEELAGRTMGKLITGTKVVNESGNKATFGQILGRTFCRFIPFEAFSFLGEEGRGWHDRIPKTYVVKCR